MHDNSGEFTGWEFQQLLEQTGIRDKPTTAMNPQSNAVCEWMHQTIENILCTLLHGMNVTNEEQAHRVVDNALATAMHALWTSVSKLLNDHSPGSLAFH